MKGFQRLRRAAASLFLISGLACANAGPALPLGVNAEDGLALDGYDPVAYFTMDRDTPGDPAHSLVSGGVRYQFASQEHLALFTADPERYLPEYGGYCAYAMVWNRLADVDPRYWSIKGGRLFLNNNRLAHTLWRLRETSNVEAADRNWGSTSPSSSESPAAR